MSPLPHRPVSTIVQANTIRVEKLQNKSGKYVVKRKNWDAAPFIHRDNNVLNYLQLYNGTSKDVKNKVFRALMTKGDVSKAPAIMVMDSDDKNHFVGSQKNCVVNASFQFESSFFKSQTSLRLIRSRRNVMHVQYFNESWPAVFLQVLKDVPSE